MAKKNWIYMKCGLSRDPKHRAQMGECVWLYMHIIDRADWETGIAYDWKDREEAAEMGMPVDTLRAQRQKLESWDYIRGIQKQHSQDLRIMEWRNPRDYGAEIKNPRSEGMAQTPPSEFQGDSQGSSQGSSQVPRQEQTPTLPSKSKISKKSKREAPTPDFKNMTQEQAYKFPTLKMYREATGFFPGFGIWESVHQDITDNNITFEQLKTASVAWQKIGYKKENVAGILEWAINGIPEHAKRKSHQPTEPQGFDAARKFLAKHGVKDG